MVHGVLRIGNLKSFNWILKQQVHQLAISYQSIPKIIFFNQQKNRTVLNYNEMLVYFNLKGKICLRPRLVQLLSFRLLIIIRRKSVQTTMWGRKWGNKGSRSGKSEMAISKWVSKSYAFTFNRILSFELSLPWGC